MINLDEIKRVIPAPSKKRGKVEYMMNMQVGDAFYENRESKERYRRLRDYAQMKNKNIKFFVGDSFLLAGSNLIKTIIVWRTT